MATSIDLAQRLLGAAENDELMARSLLPVEGVTDAGIGFNAQQAVEKAIKAVLAAKGTEFPFTHNLKQLRTRLFPVSRSEAESEENGAERDTPLSHPAPAPCILLGDARLS
jgi:HEPN domain-containing protein